MRTEDRNLLAFLGAAFAWSWFFWLPRALEAQGIGSVPQLPNVGAWGPTLAAFALTYATLGRNGILELAKRGVDIDFRARWWVAALLLFPTLNGTVLLLGVLLGEPLPSVPWAGNPVAVPVAFVVVLLTTGPLQEEFGWRGYALDRLQSRWSALTASLVLGVVWAAWHLPLFFFDPSIIYRPENAVGFLPSILLVTVIITWVYNNTGGSVLAALLVHASFNFSHWALPVLETPFAREAYLIALLALTAVVVLGWGPRDLARRRSGGDTVS